MNFFIDTEFIEGVQKHGLQSVAIKKKPTIDLISIAVVCRGKSYYAISSEFNLIEAWERSEGTEKEPIYWIRENVLFPIFKDWFLEGIAKNGKTATLPQIKRYFTLKNFTKLLQDNGKTLIEITSEIKEFVYGCCTKEEKPIFYGMYSAYDWVVFCWLFGSMNELPAGFPYYCIDLVQMKDVLGMNDFEFPKQTTGIHNALEDARHCLECYTQLIEANKR